MNDIIVYCDPGFTPESIKANMQQFQQQALAAARVGAKAAALLLQRNAESTTAYSGVTGATRASTIAYLTDPAGAAEFDTAYNVASLLLEGNTQHDGQVYRAPTAGPTRDTDIMIILTVPTDYIVLLETENAGRKAFLKDALIEESGEMTQRIAAASRAGL